MYEQIVYTKVSGKDIGRIIDLFGEAVIGEKVQHIFMACLAFALTIEHPDITPDQLKDGIKGASEWISLYISSLVNQGKAN